MTREPQISTDRHGGLARLRLSGDWTIAQGPRLEAAADQLVEGAKGAQRAIFDFGQMDRMDTAGAWLIDRSRQSLEAMGAVFDCQGASAHHVTLLKEAGWRAFEDHRPRPSAASYDLVENIGANVVGAVRDLFRGTAFLGASVVSIFRAFFNPSDFRPTSIVYHLENFGLRSVPIIGLISFLVGCIVAQQGIFQLRTFGAQDFAVNLIGILVLRELGVLLTSIMMAGRSGSAITAEIGSMKMREEVDALKVMGLSPMQTLVAPRLIALIIAMPMLTFLADMAAICGGLLVAWFYGGLNPEAFMTRLQSSIYLSTFLVGVIKAPFMGAVIGLIGCMEGMATEGSAESLGRQVTSAVVKSIFMVIVVDGLFTMFFAAINY